MADGDFIRFSGPVNSKVADSPRLIPVHASGHAAGNTVVVFASHTSAGAISGITDDKGNTYTECALDNTGTPLAGIWFSVLDTALVSGDDIIVTYSVTQNRGQVALAAEFEGAATFDSPGVIAQGTSASPSSGNKTPASAPAVAVGWVAVTGEMTDLNESGSWTMIAEDNSGTAGATSTNIVALAMRQALSTTDPVAATATVTSAAWVAAIAVFTFDAGGGATVEADALAPTATIPTPAISAGATITATALAVTATIPTAVASVASLVPATPLAPTGTIPTPVVAGSAVVDATAATATTTIPPPTVSGGAGVAASALAPTATVPTPSVSGGTGAEVTPPALAPTATIPTPAISTPGPAVVDVRPFVWASTGFTDDLIYDDTDSDFELFVVTAHGIVVVALDDGTDSVEVPAAAVAATASIPTPAVSTGTTVTASALAPVATIPTPAVSSPSGASLDVRPFVWASTGVVADRIYDMSEDFVVTDFGLVVLEDPNALVTPDAVVATAGIPTPTVSADTGVTDLRPFIWKVTGRHDQFIRDELVAFTELGPVPFTAPTELGNASVQPDALAVQVTIPIPSVTGTLTATALAPTATIPTPLVANDIGVEALPVTATIPTPTITAGTGTEVTPDALVATAVIETVSLEYGGNVYITPSPLVVAGVINPAPSSGSAVEDTEAVVATGHIPTPLIEVDVQNITVMATVVVATAHVGDPSHSPPRRPLRVSPPRRPVRPAAADPELPSRVSGGGIGRVGRVSGGGKPGRVESGD